MKLNVKAFGLAFGLLWGFGVFFGTWYLIALYGYSQDTSLLGQVYLGHSLTALGSVIGLAWGFLDGLIGGLLLAWLYNALSSKFSVSPD